jgi:hypothetical protein
MIARVTAFQAEGGALDQVARLYESQVVPWLEAATGFGGMMILLDREGGRALALSFWADAEALGGAREALERFRTLVANTIGSTNLGIDEYEVALAAGISFHAGLPARG